MSRNPRSAGKSLAELGAVKEQLARQAAEQAQAAKAAAEQERLRQQHHHLFARAVGAITPLKDRNTLPLRTPAAQPVPRQRLRDEAQALHEALSDEVDVTSLLDTQADLSFARSGVGPDVVRKLRQGAWSVQSQIDLHGLRTDEARQALGDFIRLAHQQGVRCVRVVHGKGLGSPAGVPVLKAKVQRWLTQKSQVLAFVQAPPVHGGAGALLVLLQPVGRV